MYLYFGYLLVLLYSMVVKLFQTSMSPSIMFFSIMVIFIWSVIPFIGYGVAKLFNAKGQLPNYISFTVGISIGLIENSLFYFDILAKEQNTTGTFIVFMLFFIVCLMSFGYERFP